MFYCPRCRGIIKSEDKFCPSCGEKVNPEVFQQKLDDDNISEVTPGNEESSIVNSQSQSGKEDPQQSEDRLVKAKIIDENSEKKVIVDNLKIPFRKNRKIIFSLITLIAIVMVAVSFFGDDKSASIYGSYKGNFEDDINTPVYIKYDGEKAYLSLAGDYFAVYDKISEDLIEGADSKDLYNIKLKYNDAETRNLENGYSNINVGYVQLTGSYSQDSCMITISDVIPIGSDDTFAFGSVFKVSDSEFPEIIEKNSQVVIAESTRKTNIESESIIKDDSESKLLPESESNIKETPEITSLTMEDIITQGDSMGAYFDASWKFTQDNTSQKPGMNGAYALQLTNKTNYSIRMDTHKFSIVAYGGQENEIEYSISKKYSARIDNVTINPNESFTIENLFIDVGDQLLLYHKIKYDEVSLWENNLDTYLIPVTGTPTGSETQLSALSEDELRVYAKAYVDNWNGYDNTIKEEYWDVIDGIEVKYYVFHDGPTQHIVGVYINPDTGVVTGDYGGIQ